MGYNLLKNGVYCGYNPLTNLLLTSWDIQVRIRSPKTFQHRQANLEARVRSQEQLPTPVGWLVLVPLGELPSQKFWEPWWVKNLF